MTINWKLKDSFIFMILFKSSQISSQTWIFYQCSSHRDIGCSDKIKLICFSQFCARWNLLCHIWLLMRHYWHTVPPQNAACGSSLFFPKEWHKPSMRWNMDSCRFRQKLVVLMTFLIFKLLSWTWRKTSCVFTQCHWHTVPTLSKLYIRFLAVPLEHLGKLKFLPFLIFPFSFSYSKKPQHSNPTYHYIHKEISSRYQFLKSLSKTWELGLMLPCQSVTFISGDF